MRKLLIDVTAFTCLAVTALATIGFIAAKPDKTPPKSVPVPDLSHLGETNWGEFKQDGRKLTLRGNSHWEADGEIRKDGKVWLVWTLLSDGKRAPGLYDVKDKTLVGLWAYGEDVTIEDDGTVTGLRFGDQIYRRMPGAEN